MTVEAVDLEVVREVARDLMGMGFDKVPEGICIYGLECTG